MSRYKLLALDMDGTVLNKSNRISAENQKWIKAAVEAGVHVMFATGRGIQSVLPFVEELQLQAPIITVNGGEVWRAPGDLAVRHKLDLDTLKKLYQIAVERDTWYWAYAVDGDYNKDHWTDRIEEQEWLKFGFHTEDTPVREQIRKTLEGWGGLELTNSSPLNIEVNPKGISKASGVREVCGMLGIDMSEVVAMGDSLNDIAMIKAVGLGVAMGNAQAPVIDAADQVTVTNEQDGVAKIIREVFLNSL